MEPLEQAAHRRRQVAKDYLLRRLSSTAHQLQNDHDHGHDQQDVDQEAGNMKDEEAQEPKNNKDGGDGKQHFLIPHVSPNNAQEA